MHARGRKQRRTAAAIAALLFLTASATGAQAADFLNCMDQRKADAIQVRELQTHLMVAALVCDARAEYNAFVNRFTPALVQHGEQFRRYFSGTFGPDGGSHMNRFVTDLANRVSQLSASRPGEFCARTLSLFGEAKADTLSTLLPAEARTVSLDGGSCRVALR